jgi:hypothetical protein
LTRKGAIFWDVSSVLAACFLLVVRLAYSSNIKMKYVPPKHRQTSIRLHCLTWRKIVLLGFRHFFFVKMEINRELTAMLPVRSYVWLDYRYTTYIV